MTKAQIKAAVADCSLFYDCEFTPGALFAQSFKRGETVTDRYCGEPVIGIIAKGEVGVYNASPQQSAVSLSSLGKGDVFGVSNLFSDLPLETRLVCRERTDIVFVSKQAFLEMMAQNPALSVRYMTLLNNKIRFLLERIALFTAQSGRAKLTEYLLANANGENVVQLGCSKEQLAKLLGISRAALFRELAALSQSGLISVDKKRITLLGNAAALKSFNG